MHFVKYIEYIILKNNNYWLFLKKFDLLFVLNFFIKTLFFKLNFLNDIAAVDYPGNKDRFKLVYILSNNLYNFKIYFTLFVKIFKRVSSIIYLFFSSKWLEREIWDMFGVNFFNNNDLRRILTDYNFKGHPLRKDFPLSGFYELAYFEKYAAPIYKKIELMQEMRFYSMTNNWEEWDEGVNES